MTVPPDERRWTGTGTRREAYAARDWTVLGAVSLIWGSSFLFIAVGLDAFDPRVIAAARIVFGIAALAVVPSARRAIRRVDLGPITLVGVAGVAAPALLFAVAEQTVSSAVTGMLVSATPLASVLVASVANRRLPGRIQGWGLAVGTVGVAMLAFPNLSGATASPSGVAMILAAVFGYGLANNLYPPLHARYGALAVMLWAQVVAGILLLPLGIAGLPHSTFEVVPFLAVLALGIFGTGLARAMHVALVARVGPERGTVAAYTIPVIALVLGVWLRDEVVGAVEIAGVVVALFGGWLLSRRDRRS